MIRTERRCYITLQEKVPNGTKAIASTGVDDQIFIDDDEVEYDDEEEEEEEDEDDDDDDEIEKHYCSDNSE
ncbi:hypothetical protein R6Q59_001974 [Mikania micrantha]